MTTKFGRRAAAGCAWLVAQATSSIAEAVRMRNAEDRIILLALLPNLLKVVRPLLVGSHDVEQSVAIDVRHFKLRAHAAVVIELVRNPHRLAILASQLEPLH